MIRLLAGVTPGAGLIGAATHVVGAVAARALLMGRHAGLTQHLHVLVTTAAGRGLFLGKLVRAMTAHAFQVPTFEQRRGRDQRLLFGVAGHARREGIRGRRVLFLMTRGADLIRRLAVDRMSWRDLLVALAARAGLRRGILVRLMAAQALFAGVHLHGGCVVLGPEVAVRTITGLVRVSW
jgi:hypothetical protein